MPALEGGLERLFIGVPVPETARLALRRQIPSSLPGKPSPLENWHFTLRFLGSVDSVRRGALIEHLGATNFGNEFEIEFDKIGAFPNPRKARVIWIGVGKGRESLEKIADKAESAAVKAGFQPESRKFSAHLTISRLKLPESIAPFLAKAQTPHSSMQVSEVILYRSEAGEVHSRYSVVAAFPVGQRTSS